MLLCSTVLCSPASRDCIRCFIQNEVWQPPAIFLFPHRSKKATCPQHIRRHHTGQDAKRSSSSVCLSRMAINFHAIDSGKIIANQLQIHARELLIQANHALPLPVELAKKRISTLVNPLGTSNIRRTNVRRVYECAPSWTLTRLLRTTKAGDPPTMSVAVIGATLHHDVTLGTKGRQCATG